jgi:hypothetical protein
MINATFVGQAQGDMRQKLQKVEGFAGMNASKVLEVPQRFLSVKIRMLSGRLTGR